MRKSSSYILIFLILVQLFAPVSFIFDNNKNIDLKVNRIEAQEGVRMNWKLTGATSTSLSGEATVWIDDVAWYGNDAGAVINLFDSSVNKIAIDSQTLNLISVDRTQQEKDQGTQGKYRATFSFPNTKGAALTEGTNYYIQGVVSQDMKSWGNYFFSFASGPLYSTVSTFIGTHSNTTTISELKLVRTLSKGETWDNSMVIEGTAVNETALLPVCSGLGTIGGCIGHILYWFPFKISALIFGATGHLLDLAVDYSTNDESYRSPFVSEGWKIVRDFCNMFFIFILLYIAIGTILDLHGVKTKEMIINVIIIGLLINFSLFTTQVIIDASNILTRVFYNSESIKVGPKVGGVIQEQRGSQGEIKLSEAIVSKINPQNLIINASRAENIPTKGNVGDNNDTNKDAVNNKISASTFITVVLMASIVNIVGIIVFLSVSLIFITRVIGLWLAMIFAPLAFFSYTVPAMQEWGMVGWKNWWPETLKMAFLSPVFIFFLYLTIKFLDTGLGLTLNDSKSGMDFILGVIIPFIFIMVLLWKAKDIAKDMSGKLGQSITNGLAAVGGVALGGAALGTAFLGRKMIGQTIARASRGDTATQKYEDGRAKGISKITGFVGSKIGMGKAFGKDINAIDPKTGKRLGITTGIGGMLNEKQRKVGAIDHARHEMDSMKDKAGLKDVSDDKLSGVNEIKIRETYEKEKRSIVESEIKTGKVAGVDSEDEFKKKARTGSIRNQEIATGRRESSFTDADKKAVENTINVEFNKYLKDKSDKKLTSDFGHIREESKKHVGIIDRGLSKSNTGSYDVRKLSDLKTDKRESFLTKIPVGLIAGISTGVRAGIKNIGLSNGGIKVQGDFLKDLGNTISDSLKNMKINVDLSSVGEHKSSADAHGASGGGHH